MELSLASFQREANISTEDEGGQLRGRRKEALVLSGQWASLSLEETQQTHGSWGSRCLLLVPQPLASLHVHLSPTRQHTVGSRERLQASVD